MRTTARCLVGLCALIAAFTAAAQCTMEGNLSRWPQQVTVVQTPLDGGTSVELLLGPGPYFTVLREAVARTGSTIRVSGIPYYFGDIGLPPGYSGPHRTPLGVLPPDHYTLVLDLDGVECTDIVRTFRVGLAPAATPIPVGHPASVATLVLLMLSGLLALRGSRRSTGAPDRSGAGSRT